MSEDKPIESPIAKSVNKFILYIESLSYSLPRSMIIASMMNKAIEKTFVDFLKEKNITQEKDEKGTSYQIKMDDLTKFSKLKKRVDSVNLSQRIIPESFFVSLISHFDSFIADLIRALFLIKPDVLNSSEKKLTFSELLKFKDLESAREYIIEKEIESVMRESHTAQFDWLENKFNIKLRVNLPSWPKFIEITERRNLYVHCNGLISSQYLTVCAQNEVILGKELKVGQRLVLNQEYFENAYHVLFEIGVKLANVLWRKLIPEEIENADIHLNEICYDLISVGDYELSATLLEFATSILKKHSENVRKTFIINLAQAYKWMGNNSKTKEILGIEDWSACNNNFKLVKSVLLDDFDEVFEIMDIVGKDEFMRIAYKEWPLFKELRKNQRFIDKYKIIFDEDFSVTEFDDIFEIRKKKSKDVEKNSNPEIKAIV